MLRCCVKQIWIHYFNGNETQAVRVSTPVLARSASMSTLGGRRGGLASVCDHKLVLFNGLLHPEPEPGLLEVFHHLILNVMVL